MIGTPSTLRYYPQSKHFVGARAARSAGRAHQRLHEAQDVAGIAGRGGTRGLTIKHLIRRYRAAWDSPSVKRIRGELRTPRGKNVFGKRLVSPATAVRHIRRALRGRE